MLREVRKALFKPLCQGIAESVRCHNAIIDGEIVCWKEDGRTCFGDLFHRRKPAGFVAFDLLWVDGVDQREESLVERKEHLRSVVPAATWWIGLAHGVSQQGRAIFERVCAEDLEGVVAKWTRSPYALLNGRSPWVKIRNPRYGQAAGRSERFERRKR